MSILSLQHVTIKHLQHQLLTDIDLNVKDKQHWLLVGPSGSGKTVLLNAVAGTLRPNLGHVEYDDNVKKHISLVTSKHHFKDVTNTSTNMYYQQRYNSSDSDQTATAGEYLQQKAARHFGYWTTELVTELLNLRPLLHKELIKLSNGETKRLRLAHALLDQPKLLLLDDPLSGLDHDTQQNFDHILQAIIDHGTTVIMSGSGFEIPSPITHVAVLDKGSISKTMPASEYDPNAELPPMKIERERIESLVHDRQLGKYEHIVKMTNVNIRYGDNQILDQVDWTIAPGDRWALFGHNGAGKSTLLSLINGDNPQAYANDIVLFDKKRGSGESIWDIKKKIGFLSPELYQYFPNDQSGLQVIESGSYDTQGLFRPSSPAKANIAMEWMKALQIDQYARTLLKHMPASVQRSCLLARALIKVPDLLILDEPCQGLDKQQRIHFNQVIDVIAASTPLTMIYVTHYANELPGCVDKVLKLAKGKVVSS